MLFRSAVSSSGSLRSERRKEPDEDTAAGRELDRRYPPLIEAHGRNAERLKFIDERTMALHVEQLVVARKHEERPDRDAVEGRCRSTQHR